MKEIVFGILTLMIAAAAFADDSKVEAILRERLELIEQAKVESEAMMEAMRKGSIRPRQKEPSAMGRVGKVFKFAFRSKEDREKAIEEWTRKTSDEALAAKAAPPLLIRNAMGTGDFGYLPDHVVELGEERNSWQFKVQQVIDERNMLVKVTQFSHSRGREVGDYLVWITGRFGDLVDGQSVAFSGVFIVSGTKQYTTAIGGSKTVYMLERFDIAPIVERLKAEAASKKTVIPESDAMPAFREWSDATGQFKMTARLISVADGNVKLERKDGSVATVPISKLSESDQKVLPQNASVDQ